MKEFAVLFLFGLFFAPQLAMPQVQVGTIAAIYFSDDKIAVAADSRNSTLQGTPVSDEGCKIATFGQQIIFVNAGAAGFTPPLDASWLPSWDNVGEAKKAFEAARVRSDGRGKDSVLARTADQWGANLMIHWDSVYHAFPGYVTEAAKRGNGTLATGMFGGLINGKLALFQISITFDADRSRVVSYKGGDTTCPHQVCAIGEPDVVVEYRDETSLRARIEASEWRQLEKLISPRDRPALKAIRLVDLSIAYLGSTEVGGFIDCVEIDKRGAMRWIARKENCPE